MDDENNGEPVAQPHGGALRSWKPGQSGNPKGIPEYAREVTRLAKEAGPTVMRRLIEIATDPNEDPRASIVAGERVLDRAFGKAKDVPLSPDETGRLDLNHLTPEQIEELKAAMEVIYRLTGRGLTAAPTVQIYLPDNKRESASDRVIARLDQLAARQGNDG